MSTPVSVVLLLSWPEKPCTPGLHEAYVPHVTFATVSNPTEVKNKVGLWSESVAEAGGIHGSQSTSVFSEVKLPARPKRCHVMSPGVGSPHPKEHAFSTL